MCFSVLRSSVGRKFVVAVTGLLLTGFVVAHMLGNLQVFLGPDALNDYAKHLQSLPGLLWPARIALLSIFIVHIAVSLSLAFENRRARPDGYRYQDTVQASLASRTMVWTGITIFLFTVYHLLHFTWGAAHPAFFHLVDEKGRNDVYSMVVLSFREPLISGVYIAAMAALCFHLSHGIASIPQSLGLSDAGKRPFFEKAATALSWLIFLGNASMPVAALLKILKLPGEL